MSDQKLETGIQRIHADYLVDIEGVCGATGEVIAANKQRGAKRDRCIEKQMAPDSAIYYKVQRSCTVVLRVCYG